MDDEAYFMVERYEWQQEYIYESKGHTEIEQANFIRTNNFLNFARAGHN
jgi:hypothetical protein